MPPLFPPASWRPAYSQVALLALARDDPDMNQVISDLKAPYRAGRFEIPERLGQIFLKIAKLFCSAAAELMQILDRQRMGRGMARVEAVQP